MRPAPSLLVAAAVGLVAVIAWLGGLGGFVIGAISRSGNPQAQSGTTGAVPPITRPNEGSTQEPSQVGHQPIPANVSHWDRMRLSLHEIENETDLVTRMELEEKFLEAFGGDQRKASLEAFWNRDLTGAAQDLRMRLLRNWAEQDPAQAAEWLLQQKAGALRANGVGSVAAAWSDRDSAAAISWVHQLEGEEREAGLSRVAYELARTEPIEALRLAIEMAPSSERDDLLAHTASQWAGKEPQVAADWVSDVQDPSLRAKLLGSVLVTWSDQNPSEAAEFALKARDGDLTDAAVVGIVQRWAQQDPQTASRWVEQFPPGALREAAAENLIDLWSDQDAAQVGIWLNSLKDQSLRDTSTAAYVRKLTPADPRLAAQWAGNIGLESLRNQELESLGSYWLLADPSAARTWIVQSSLPEAVKTRLLSVRK